MPRMNWIARCAAMRLEKSQSGGGALTILAQNDAGAAGPENSKSMIKGVLRLAARAKDYN
jgi:hypothetical protein